MNPFNLPTPTQSSKPTIPLNLLIRPFTTHFLEFCCDQYLLLKSLTQLQYCRKSTDGPWTICHIDPSQSRLEAGLWKLWDELLINLISYSSSSKITLSYGLTTNSLSQVYAPFFVCQYYARRGTLSTRKPLVCSSINRTQYSQSRDNDLILKIKIKKVKICQEP